MPEQSDLTFASMLDCFNKLHKCQTEEKRLRLENAELKVKLAVLHLDFTVNGRRWTGIKWDVEPVVVHRLAKRWGK